MSEHKRDIFLAVILAIVLVMLLGGASYYLLPPEPIPSPTPTVTPSPTPIPTVTPSLAPTPTSTPPGPEIRVEVVSLDGFSHTEMGGGAPEKVPVLHQGTSGNITLTVYSSDKRSHNVSLVLSVAGMNKELEGVKCKFYPSTLELAPQGEAGTTLMLEADLDAPNGLYLPMLSVYVEGDFKYGTNLPFYILVFPYTPAYIFYVNVQTPVAPSPPPTSVPTPIPTPTSPPPSPTDETTPTPIPTPIPTPPSPEPWKPEIQVERGEKTYILFYIYTEIENPSLTLNLTCQPGALPAGINAEVTQEPLQVVQNPYIYKSLLLTLTIDPETPEGTYEIVAEGTVGQISYERTFRLHIRNP